MCGRRRVENGAMNSNETSKSINSRCTDFRNSIVEKRKKTCFVNGRRRRRREKREERREKKGERVRRE